MRQSDFPLFGPPRGVTQGLENIFAFQVGIIGEDLFNAAARPDLAHNRANGHAHPAYARFSTHHARILSDAIELWHCHLPVKSPCPQNTMLAGCVELTGRRECAPERVLIPGSV